MSFQTFIENNSYTYTHLNSLRKTDKIDAEKLAQSQFVLNRKPTYVQEKVYHNLRDVIYFYQSLTENIVQSKNQESLHKILQGIFIELENRLSTPSGEHYWNVVVTFPCKKVASNLNDKKLSDIIHQSTSKRISYKRVTYLVDKLIELANQSYCAVKKKKRRFVTMFKNH